MEFALLYSFGNDGLLQHGKHQQCTFFLKRTAIDNWPGTWSVPTAGRLSVRPGEDEGPADGSPDDSQMTTVSSIAPSEWGNDIMTELARDLQSEDFLSGYVDAPKVSSE
jgi:hypothetical protein